MRNTHGTHINIFGLVDGWRITWHVGKEIVLGWAWKATEIVVGRGGKVPIINLVS